jgi:ketopantoate reductase
MEQSTDNTVVIDFQNMLENIEQEIIQYWPRNKTITPDDVRDGSELCRKQLVKTVGLC